MRTYMTPQQVVMTYLFAVARWALFGAIGAYSLLLMAFSWVGVWEGLSFSLLPVPGFFFLCMCVGAFVGGASGVEVGQILCIEKERSMRAAAERHPSARVGENPFTHGNPAWRPEHDDATDYDYW